MSDPQFYPHWLIDHNAERRGGTYLADFEAAIIDRSAAGVTYDRAHPAWIAAKEKYQDAPPAPRKPKPISEWPFAARLAARFRGADDKGLGDTVTRMAGAAGGEVVKRWYEHITGKECGCDDRAARLNQMFPY